MLDLGANTECDAQNLVQFAVMGAAYARTVLGIAKPRVKLLNIGTEELKGTGELKEAAALLRDADYLPMRFDGFTEGDQLSRGNVDVIVTDGFSGNIALKTAEGTARFVTDLLRRAFTSSLRSKAGFALSRPALQPAQGPSRPQQSQWRGLPRPQRPGREEPRQRQRQGRRQRHRRRRADGPQRHHPADRRGPRQFPRPRLRQRTAAMTLRSVIVGSRHRRFPRGGSPMPSLPSTVDTTDEWIVERTGIRSRYIAGDGETTATLATDAAREALDHAGVDAREIDLIVLATATPDQTFPSSATKVQAALGIDDCIAFDVHAVCTGFLYALTVADSMLRSGTATRRW